MPNPVGEEVGLGVERGVDGGGAVKCRWWIEEGEWSTKDEGNLVIRKFWLGFS